MNLITTLPNKPLTIICSLIQSLGIMLLAIGAIKIYLHEGWPNYCVLGIGLVGLSFTVQLANKHLTKMQTGTQ